MSRRNETLFLFFFRNEDVLLDPIPVHFASQRTSVDPQEKGGLNLISSGLLEGPED